MGTGPRAADSTLRPNGPPIAPPSGIRGNAPHIRRIGINTNGPIGRRIGGKGNGRRIGGKGNGRRIGGKGNGRRVLLTGNRASVPRARPSGRVEAFPPHGGANPVDKHQYWYDTRRPADNARSWSGLTMKLKNCQSDMLQEEHVACLARGQTGEMV